MLIKIKGEMGITINDTDVDGIFKLESSSNVAVYFPGQSGGERVQIC